MSWPRQSWSECPASAARSAGVGPSTPARRRHSKPALTALVTLNVSGIRTLGPLYQHKRTRSHVPPSPASESMTCRRGSGVKVWKWGLSGIGRRGVSCGVGGDQNGDTDSEAGNRWHCWCGSMDGDSGGHASGAEVLPRSKGREVARMPEPAGSTECGRDIVEVQHNQTESSPFATLQTMGAVSHGHRVHACTMQADLQDPRAAFQYCPSTPCR